MPRVPRLAIAEVACIQDTVPSSCRDETRPAARGPQAARPRRTCRRGLSSEIGAPSGARLPLLLLGLGGLLGGLGGILAGIGLGRCRGRGLRVDLGLDLLGVLAVAGLGGRLGVRLASAGVVTTGLAASLEAAGWALGVSAGLAIGAIGGVVAGLASWAKAGVAIASARAATVRVVFIARSLVACLAWKPGLAEHMARVLRRGVARQITAP